MADSKITGLSDGGAVQSTDEFVVARSGANYKIAGSNIASSSPLTTKGDVFGHSTVDARIPVGTNGQALFADSTQTLGVGYQYPPAHEIGYDQITANVTVASATEATGTTIITASAYTFPGSAVICTFFSPNVSAGAGDFVTLALFEGATEIARLCTVNTTSSGGPTLCQIRFTPTAASHTYKVTGSRGSANGTVNAGASGTGAFGPAFLRFTMV